MDKKQLLLELYNAESSEDVFKVINKYNLNGPKYWKPYGGSQNNAGTFENQQSSPENALVEKLTNSIDAILMKECYVRGINPKDQESPNVPKTIEDAVESFYGVKDGKWDNKTDDERRNMAESIQIIVTGDRKTPNIAVYDDGEGQNPDNFPNTFLSIAHGNKNDIPFVQGKYNFGATGALAFSGDEHKYQMIISRRNENLTDAVNRIGFTLVRRHILDKEEEKKVKLTWYEYLVLDDRIPQINAEPLNLNLNKGKPFISGSVVKMFSYQLKRPSIATFDLWRDLNPLLYVPAIPVLICENRDFAGHSDSKPMLGNRTRLALDGKDKVAFRKDLQIVLFNSIIPISVYIFKRDTKNSEFIGGKSVIYTLNGQTQGAETKSFISQDLGFVNLREYMLVSVDCSQLGTTARQELFMASRDRLKKGKYYNELLEDIINLLKSDEDIKQKEQEYKGKIFKESGEDKNLVEAMFANLKRNKDIRNILSGAHGPIPFFNKKTNTEANESESKKKQEKRKLNRYPTIFRVKGFEKDNKDYIKVIKRGGRGTITLETDVENEFLSRSYDNGKLTITTLDYGHGGNGGSGYLLPNEDNKKLKVQSAGPYDGEIKIHIEPQKEAEVGEKIPLSIKMISSAGENEVIVYIKVDKEEEEKHKKSQKKKTDEPETSLPQLIRVVKENPGINESTWADEKMNADSIVSFRIASKGEIETIFVNMDSNLVKKLINLKGVKIEDVRNKYLINVYSHALMIYASMYRYYSQNDIELDEGERKHVQEILDKAVEFSFKYYMNFVMMFEQQNG